MMKVTFLGHACFLLDDGKYKLLTDPFLTGNPLAAVPADQVEADYIFVTHGHGDHLGDAVDIARRTGAPVCCTADLGNAVFAPAGVETIQGNLGGRMKLPFGSFKFTPAIHGSGVPGCLSCGFLFEMGGRKIYHAGDTSLTCDLALLEPEHIDVALLPIGDVYTMGPEDALRAAEMIKPQMVVPMHYDTMPPLRQDAQVFAASVRDKGMQCLALKPGESLTL